MKRKFRSLVVKSPYFPIVGYGYTRKQCKRQAMFMRAHFLGHVRELHAMAEATRGLISMTNPEGSNVLTDVPGFFPFLEAVCNWNPSQPVPKMQWSMMNETIAKYVGEVRRVHPTARILKIVMHEYMVEQGLTQVPDPFLLSPKAIELTMVYNPHREIEKGLRYFVSLFEHVESMVSSLLWGYEYHIRSKVKKTWVPRTTAAADEAHQDNNAVPTIVLQSMPEIIEDFTPAFDEDRATLNEKLFERYGDDSGVSNAE